MVVVVDSEDDVLLDFKFQPIIGLGLGLENKSLKKMIHVIVG